LGSSWRFTTPAAHSILSSKTYIVMSSSLFHQQTFAQRLDAKYQAALAANNNLVDQVERLVPLCDTTSTPNDWEQEALARKFCADERIRGKLRAQERYGILGVNDPLETEGCRLIVCGSNLDHALGIPLLSSVEYKKRGYTMPVLLEEISNLRAVCAGSMHSVALTTTGMPFSWGSCDGGALGRHFTERELIGDRGSGDNVVGPAGTDETPHPITGLRVCNLARPKIRFGSSVIHQSSCHPKVT
jgi:hypothetical protein